MKSNVEGVNEDEVGSSKIGIKMINKQLKANIKKLNGIVDFVNTLRSFVIKVSPCIWSTPYKPRSENR